MENDGRQDVQENRTMSCSDPLTKQKKYVYCWGQEEETMLIGKQERSPTQKNFKKINKKAPQQHEIISFNPRSSCELTQPASRTIVL